MRKRSFTLLELVAVIVIIGILATLGWSYFGPVKEKFLDKEAIVSLKLIQVAEKIYRMEYHNYYPIVGGSKEDIATINLDLKLDLPALPNRNWNYKVYSTGCAEGTRNVTGGRTWDFTIGDSDGEPDPGATCP